MCAALDYAGFDNVAWCVLAAIGGERPAIFW